MHHYIILLSDLSYQLGLIGIAEYEERREIADWLSTNGDGKPDPRGGRHDEPERPRENDETGEKDGAARQGGSGSANAASDDDPWLPQFLAFNKWMFTIGDRDCYPSVPHGHLKKKTNAWPKLNPYTGRVFDSVHVENTSSRLSRSEMKKLWNDEDFVAHCRSQVVWYSDFAPAYTFPGARSGRYRFPKW